MLSRPLAIGITILVSVVWASINAAALLSPERYDVDNGINAIFMLVLGAVLGLTPKREQVDRARRAIARRRQQVLPDEEEGPDTNAPSRGDGP